jgi:hypothetical protein
LSDSWGCWLDPVGAWGSEGSGAERSSPSEATAESGTSTVPPSLPWALSGGSAKGVGVASATAEGEPDAAVGESDAAVGASGSDPHAVAIISRQSTTAVRTVGPFAPTTVSRGVRQGVTWGFGPLSAWTPAWGRSFRD